MSAAAATSRQRLQRQKSVAKARSTLRRKQERQKQFASQVFDKLSNDAGRLDDDKVELFLETSLSIQADQLNRDALQMVRDAAQKRFRQSMTENHPNGFSLSDTQVTYSKEGIMHAFQKYSFYLRNMEEIDSIFDKFDVDRDGHLSRKELHQALQEREHTNKRVVKGVVTEFFVTEEDLDFILEYADERKDGMIDKAEVLPAVACWEEIAEGYVAEMEASTSCACVIL